MKSHPIREDSSLYDARERRLRGFRILLYKLAISRRGSHISVDCISSRSRMSFLELEIGRQPIRR